MSSGSRISYPDSVFSSFTGFLFCSVVPVWLEDVEVVVELSVVLFVTVVLSQLEGHLLQLLGQPLSDVQFVQVQEGVQLSQVFGEIIPITSVFFSTSTLVSCSDDLLGSCLATEIVLLDGTVEVSVVNSLEIGCVSVVETVVEVSVDGFATSFVAIERFATCIC